jgi:class 3 adenylate cyclase
MAGRKELVYRWTWEFDSSPAELWPLVSNTDRFNRDCGYPSVVILKLDTLGASRAPVAPVDNARRLRARAWGLTAEWDELPFEWIEPLRFMVDHRFVRGPVGRLVTVCELTPTGSGTSLAYELRVTPRNAIGQLLSPLFFGWNARRATDRVFRRYDELARRGQQVSRPRSRVSLAPGGAERLARLRQQLVGACGQPGALVERLAEFVAKSDDLSVARMRPYALADEWGFDRRATLHLFLHAVRVGLLDFSWDLVCPHCRGATPGKHSLTQISPQAHCPSCDVDFTANFDQSVELTFISSPSVRPVHRTDYCIGGPQVTPHILAQQRIKPRQSKEIPLALGNGRYRVRSPGEPVRPAFRVAPGGEPVAHLALGVADSHEPVIAGDGRLVLENHSDATGIAIVEHVSWSDQAATAAEVTSLQLFRDLFSSEVLRPGEQISVGSMTIVFTDLKDSTRLYREIGDAPAFGRVLTHFEILKAAVAAENGGIVKTMGDAILAVFPRPLAALRAILQAQHWLARPAEFPVPDGVTLPPASLKPLALKSGIHGGPCLAINQNERLDYFGSTVNIASRLCGICSGSEIMLSESVRHDPEVDSWLASPEAQGEVTSEKSTLKGFGDETFNLWRIRLRLGLSKTPFP